MSGESTENSSDYKSSAVLRLFPAHAFEIEQMLVSDEEFRGLCGDLAAAQGALQRIDSLPVRLRAERRVECESWIKNLIQEIEGALRRKKVIALGTKRNTPREP